MTKTLENIDHLALMAIEHDPERRNAEITQRKEPVISVQAYVEAIIKIAKIGPNKFRGFSPKTARFGKRVYGGQLCAQALAAAYELVDRKFLVHSLHCNFLFPGDEAMAIDYEVTTIKQTTRFANVHVFAKQNDFTIFFCSISFQAIPLGGLFHQIPMPDAPCPMVVPSDKDRLRAMSLDARLSKHVRSAVARVSELPFAMEIRQVDPSHLFFPEKRQPNVLQWMRSHGQLSQNVLIHHCVLAYASDSAMVGTLLRPHGVSFADPRLRSASLDHSVWFHSSFRADEWMLFEVHSPVTTNGRGVAFGNIFDSSGNLVVSVAQEGYVEFAETLQTSKL